MLQLCRLGYLRQGNTGNALWLGSISVTVCFTFATVTADAMHCQRERAEKIIVKEADYLLMVKRNQVALEAAVQKAWI